MHGTRTHSGFAAVVLDPHPLYQEGLASLLARMDVRLLGVTSSTDCALELLELHRPDVFVMDVEATTGSLDPLTCLRLACERHPDVAPVVLSAQGHPRSVRSALDAGAVAYLVKTAAGEEIAAGLRQVLKWSRADHNGDASARVIPAWPLLVQPYLTHRELEILELVAAGRSNRQVARLLWISDQTVKFHLGNVYRKLKVKSRHEAAAWARAHGLIARGAATNGATSLTPDAVGGGVQAS